MPGFNAKEYLEYALASLFTRTVCIGFVDQSTREDRIDTARFLINAGSDMGSITFSSLLTWAIEWDLETFLSVFGNDDIFNWDIIQLDHDNFGWDMAFSLLQASYDDPLASQSSFERFTQLCKRLKIDLAFTQPGGRTLLHWMFKKPFDIEFSYLKHYLSVLVSNGVDPCAVCEGYLTPTLAAFFHNQLHLWFSVLRQLGISVEAVAVHALGLLVESTMPDIIFRIDSKPRYDVFDSTHLPTLKWLCSQEDKGWPTPEATKQLRAALIKAFERQGCYLNESGDRGNMITYKASSAVDFKPSTVYDPERATRDIRKRTGARKNPQSYQQ